MLLPPRRLCWRLPQSWPAAATFCDWRSDLNTVINVKRHHRLCRIAVFSIKPTFSLDTLFGVVECHGFFKTFSLQVPDNSPERFCMIEHTMPWEGPVLPQLAPHELLVCVRGRPPCATVDESALLTVSPAQKLSTKQMWLVCNTIRYLTNQGVHCTPCKTGTKILQTALAPCEPGVRPDMWRCHKATL